MMAEDGPIVLSGIAEERRLAYVAYTRAQKQLFLTCILRYRGSDAVASRFIQEAGLAPMDEDGLFDPFLFRHDESQTSALKTIPQPVVVAPTLFES